MNQSTQVRNDHHFVRNFGILGAAVLGAAALGWFAACKNWPPVDAGSKPAPPKPADDASFEAAWTLAKNSAIQNLKTNGEWSNPELLDSTINTLGWEDSVNITPDGKTLNFAYFPGDLVGFATKTGFDMSKFAEFRKGPERGVTPITSIDLLQSELVDGKWTEPARFKYSANFICEGGPMIAGGKWYYQSNAPGTADDHDDDIYVDGTKLPAPVNTQYNEFDPHFANGELYFWSDDRPGANKTKSLWMAKQGSGGKWAKPTPLPAPVNVKNANQWTPFVDASGNLYFNSDRDGRVAVWRAARKGPNAWQAPVKVLWTEGAGPLMGVAEPSMTQDGSAFYFVAIFVDPKGRLDADIGRVTKSK
jgi:hypothetical protein